VGALAGPKVRYWWTQLLLGVVELVLGVWAVRSWQRSLFTLVTLVGVWAIFHGVGEISAAFSVRETGRRAERLVGRPPADRVPRRTGRWASWRLAGLLQARVGGQASTARLGPGGAQGKHRSRARTKEEP
jgi:hypothetical protein